MNRTHQIRNTMKRFFRPLAAVCLATLLLTGCHTPVAEGPMRLIFDTDMGNDVDDAIALGLLNHYINDGRIDLLAIGLTKEGHGPMAYTDMVQTWYGHSDVPLGAFRKGAQDSRNYASIVANAVDSLTGQPYFATTTADFNALPDATTLYRRVLAAQPDHSVTFVTVGFSTNMASLLDSEPDEASPLTGRELISRKVSRLVMMAGRFNDPAGEYNVIIDIPSAQKVFAEWPTPIVTSPWELGVEVCYPASSIENDFGWTPRHPVVEAYKAYMEMPYDRPCWDPTAVLYAVEGDSLFTVSAPGGIVVADDGRTTFTDSVARYPRYVLSVTPDQATALRQRMVSLLTDPASAPQS